MRPNKPLIFSELFQEKRAEPNHVRFFNQTLQFVMLRGGLVLLICFISTTLNTGFKPVPQKIAGHAVSALLPEGSDPTPVSDSATRVAALAANAAYAPNFCTSAQQLRHWTKSVVTVRILSSEGESKRDVAAQVIKGMALWNVRTAPYLSLMPTDADNADITISFVPAGSLQYHAVGQTDVRFRRADQVLTHATIRINDRLSDAQLVQVSAHELGHALGIEGHSTDPRDLMFTHAHTPAQITDRDANTMFVAYGIPAQKGVALPQTALCATPTVGTASPADLPTTEDSTGTK